MCFIYWSFQYFTRANKFIRMVEDEFIQLVENLEVLYVSSLPLEADTVDIIVAAANAIQKEKVHNTV